MPIFINPFLTRSGKLLGLFNVANTAISDGTVMGSSYGVKPGSLTVETTDGSMEIESGKLKVNPQSTPVWGECVVHSEKIFSRYLDAIFITIEKISTGQLQFGASFRDVANDGLEFACGLLYGSGNRIQMSYLSKYTDLVPYYNDLEYQYKIVLGCYNIDGGITGDRRYGFMVLQKDEIDTRWRAIYKMLNATYLPTDSVTTNGTLSETRWIDESTINVVDIVGGKLHLLDDDATLTSQTRTYTRFYPINDDFIIRHRMNLNQLNDTSQWNPSDLSQITAFAGSTGDSQFNQVGVSFPIEHKILTLRVQLWFQKAQDYGTSGNLEMWKVSDNGSGDFLFDRIWIGSVVPVGSDFEFQVEYHLDPGNTYYIVSVRVGATTIVSNEQIGMASNVYGPNSFAFQVKGRAGATAAELTAGKIEFHALFPFRFLFSNLGSTALLDDIQVKPNGIPLPVTFSSSSVSGATTFEHAINCIIDLQVGTHSVTDYLRFAFRYVDTNNYYFINVSTTQVITLQQRVAGVDTVLQTGTVVAKNETRLQVFIKDNQALVFSDNQSTLRHFFVTLNPTEQTFNFIQIPGDCVIDNLISEEMEPPLSVLSSGGTTFIETQAVPVDAGSNATNTMPVAVPTTVVTGDLIFVIVGERGGTPTFGVGAAANQTWNTAKICDNTQAQIFCCQYNGSFAGATTIDFTCSTNVCTSALLHVFRPPTVGTWVLDYTPSDIFTVSSLSPAIASRPVSGGETITIAVWITSSSRTFSALTGTGWSQSGMVTRFRNTAAGDRTYTFAYYAGSGAGDPGPVQQLASGTAAQFAAIMLTFRQS